MRLCGRSDLLQRLSQSQINEPALPLLARSTTQFVSGITATGFEFVTDTNGNATEVIIRTADSQLTAVR